jgi:hypothetical protein
MRIRIARAALLAALLASPGCFTCRALRSDAVRHPPIFVPHDLPTCNSKEALLGLAVLVVSPLVVPVVVLSCAFALDVAAFPIQVGCGFHPYGERGSP